jgi:hypothetical protein
VWSEINNTVFGIVHGHARKSKLGTLHAAYIMLDVIKTIQAQQRNDEYINFEI